MNHLPIAVFLALLMSFSMPSYADTATGKVVAITGQRVTITDNRGQQRTFTIPDAAQLSLGASIRIDYTNLGDAFVASSVTILQR